MIRFVEGPAEEARFARLCEGSAFGCRLRAVSEAYGFGYPFARFWLSETAAYCQLDGALSAAGMPEDSEEAAAFLAMSGAGELLCSASFRRALGLRSAGGGMVLVKELPPAPPPESWEFPDIPAIWRLLTASGMSLDQEGFHLDLSHRLRHGAALAFGAYAGEQLTGCAVVSAVTEREAVLSALAVEEHSRGQGVGSLLMARVERALPGKKLYILREAGKNRTFYSRLGYRPTDRWRSIPIHII